MLRSLLTLAAFTTISPLVAADRPNVVFVLADDLGVNDLGCYGRGVHRTPNLDKLAAAGTRFTAAYAAASVCSPTRAALLTGKAPARLHLTTFLPGRPDAPSQKLLHPAIATHLPDGEKSLADRLKAAGYATGCFGKWHLGGKGHQPTDHGFDVYHPGTANTRPTDAEGGKGEYDLTAAAIKFIEANKGRPFFAYLAHNSPHIPYTARPTLVTKNAAAFEPTYAAVIESLDDTVGKLLAALDALKLADNTIVVFTSDNGGLHVPELAHKRVTHNTPFRAGKGFLYDGGLRVPLIVRGPGRVVPGRTVDIPVIATDWFPTLLEWAGADVPDGLDGVSFADLLAGKKFPAERPLFWHQPHYTNQGGRPGGAVRSGNWKLIEHFEDGQLELFDLSTDPGEATDVAARDPLFTTRLRDKLAAWRKAVGAQGMAPNPAFDRATHQALYADGYPSRFDPRTADAAGWERTHEWRKRMDDVVKGRK